MSEDTDPQTYDEKTPFYKVGLSPSVMTEQLQNILWNHHINQIGVLFVAMSNFPEPFQTLCAVLNIDFDDLKQELTDRLSAKFLQSANSNRDCYQLILNPAMQRLSRYVQYCDLLKVPGVLRLREYEHFKNGLSVAVYVSLSKSDLTTALLLPPVHQKTGLPIVLLHEL